MKQSTAVCRERLCRFSFLVSRSCCVPSAAPCKQKAPWYIAGLTCWRKTSCSLSALPESGWEQGPRKCDMHFLRRWKANLNYRVEKKDKNPGIAGWESPPTREQRERLSKNGWQVCHSRCCQPEGKLLHANTWMCRAKTPAKPAKASSQSH